MTSSPSTPGLAAPGLAPSIIPASALGPVLDVQGLTVSFRGEAGWNSVVRDVNFAVGPGETVAIVGESGSGKSVTSLALMRLLPKATSRVSGRAVLGGRDLLALDDEAMRQARGTEIAMIFQEPMTSLNPIFTIGKQISEAMTCHGLMSASEAKTETIRILEKVRIPNAASRFDEYPHQFSGGMRQRVMIAMALASKPKLLIADEPTTALDVTIQGQILDLIKTLQDEEGMSVLFITHDMGVVAEIADRTLVMFRGDMVEKGPTSDVFLRPDKAYTKALLSAVPKLGSMDGAPSPMTFALVDPVTGVETNSEPVDNPKPGQQPVIEVKDLVTRFAIRSGLFQRQTGAVHAVENVSFQLYPGETLSLVGESGCGKSTTGRSIMRLVEPLSGSIMVDGYDALKLSKTELRRMRRSIQMVFQDPFASLNPRMKVGDAIAEPYLEHGLGDGKAAREKTAALLERVGLSAAAMDRYPHEFSGGQRQRICIARALILDPKVIVADESVSALDVSIKAQVCNLLMELQESLGLAYLFISHDMAVVERVSHRVAVMYLGEIVEIGPREGVFRDPQHAYTRKLMSAVPVPDPARRGIRRGLSVDEIKSPIRSVDFVPPIRTYREVGPQHYVMD